MENTPSLNEESVNFVKENSLVHKQHNDLDESNSNVHHLDTNGVKNSVFDVLPNNNVCANSTLSRCKNDKECVSSTRINIMSSPNTFELAPVESTSTDTSSQEDVSFLSDTGTYNFFP